MSLLFSKSTYSINSKLCKTCLNSRTTVLYNYGIFRTQNNFLVEIEEHGKELETKMLASAFESIPIDDMIQWVRYNTIMIPCRSDVLIHVLYCEKP